MIMIKEFPVGISFQHLNDPDEGRWCIASLVHKAGDTSFVLGEGSSFCHPSDNYNKEFGRKLALERAMADAGFTKDMRTSAWQAYLKRGGKQ